MGIIAAKGDRQRKFLGLVALAILLLSPMAGLRSASASFGSDYRQLATTSGSTNTSTSVTISTTANQSYFVDPYTDSSISGTPSTFVPHGYGWRTVGAFGQSVPAGTWSFTAEVDIPAVVTGVAVASVYVYSTDAFGGNVDFIGTADSTNLFALGTTQSRNLSFSAPAKDLTDRVLVVEYWVKITNSPPLLNTKITFHTVSMDTSVTVPTSSSTVFYLGTPRLYLAGLGDSFAAADSADRLHSSSRISTNSVSISDAVNTHVTRSIPDGITVFDQSSPGVFRPMTDTTAFSDAISTSISRSLSETLQISDGISVKLSRSISDGLSMTDSALHTQLMQRQVSDAVPVADAIAPAMRHILSDSLQAIDTAASSLSAARNNLDAVTVADSISVSVSHPASNTVAAVDSISAKYLPSRSVSDVLALSDSARVLMSSQQHDALAAADALSATANISRPTGESLAVVDTVLASIAASRPVSDSLSVADSDGAKLVVLRSAADAISAVDLATATASASRSISDALAGRDSFIARGIANSLAAADQVAATTALALDNILSATDAISTTTTRFLSDPLSTSDATAVGTPVVRNLSDSLSIAAAAKGGKAIAIADALSVSAAIAIVVRPAPAIPEPGSPAPPLGVIMVSDKNSTGLLPAAPVAGTYSIQGSDSSLLYDQLQVPAQTVNATGTQLSIVQPTYHVRLTPTPQLPTDDAFLTVKMAQIPANTPVIVPIDIASTPAATEHKVSWMKMEYAPAIGSSNFGLAISLLDTPPARAQQPPQDLTPIYIDIHWVGTFGAATSPSASSYYKDLPTLAFAITDQWAAQNGVQRDSNGVPLVSLSLLDETTGLWRPVSGIDRPSAAINGQYRYITHLEHFSTYAIMATKAATNNGGGRHAATAITPAIAPASLSAHIADSILVQESGRAAVAGRAPLSFAAGLAENIRLSAVPDAYARLEAGGVDVRLRVDSVSPASAFPPTAKVTLDAQLVNVGYSPKELVLGFADGKRYHSSTVVRVDAGESKNVAAQVPFDSPGTFGILAEVHSREGELLDSTTFTVTVPWLDVYLYLLIVLQSALAAITAGGIIILLKYRRAPI